MPSNSSPVSGLVFSSNGSSGRVVLELIPSNDQLTPTPFSFRYLALSASIIVKLVIMLMPLHLGSAVSLGTA
jgi:hypothetical protein